MKKVSPNIVLFNRAIKSFKVCSKNNPTKYGYLLYFYNNTKTLPREFSTIYNWYGEARIERIFKSLFNIDGWNYEVIKRNSIDTIKDIRFMYGGVVVEMLYLDPFLEFLVKYIKRNKYNTKKVIKELT